MATWPCLRLCGLPVLVLLSLSGCGSNAPAPIEDRGAVSSVDRSGTYKVRRGDTLYAIAFRFGLDFRRLAAGNGIAAPYTIYPGQLLDLRATSTPRKPEPAVPEAVVTAAKPAQPAARPVPQSSPSPPPVARQTKPPVAASPAPTAPVSAWRWPASGRVVRRFSSTLHKGIDLTGERGDAVLATASGRVVYAGAGIAGYGNLLIIRHNERYLSAYGHNDRLLVQEGNAVAAGQKIATRGSTGTDSVKLHFEIRRDGKPVDPLTLLPGR